LLQQKAYFLPDLEQLEVSEEILDSFDIESIDPVTLLFQSGYLTIEKAYSGFKPLSLFYLDPSTFAHKLCLEFAVKQN
jgi:hypothetical protein